MTENSSSKELTIYKKIHESVGTLLPTDSRGIIRIQFPPHLLIGYIISLALFSLLLAGKPSQQATLYACMTALVLAYFHYSTRENRQYDRMLRQVKREGKRVDATIVRKERVERGLVENIQFEPLHLVSFRYMHPDSDRVMTVLSSVTLHQYQQLSENATFSLLTTSSDSPVFYLIPEPISATTLQTSF